ncbi:ovochymase-1-like [Tribolium madens]|uniref:ovochymase-1-like n=1 Tax=Tribolium madens TaxID=41895 RepID=UPI001CF73366|nr:ovochymase-1-like [Tribolium madens]
MFLLLTTILFIAESMASSIDPNCDYYQDMQIGQEYFIYNKEYPNNYGPSTACRWLARSPENTVIVLSCNEMNVPPSSNCHNDKLLFSLTGNENFEDGQHYCGNNIFSTYTQSNSLSVGLFSNENSQGGVFLCSLAVMRLPKSECSCGLQQETKIVGGQETGVNEFPSMAALINPSTSEAFCGASLITDNYAVTAAHCLLNNKPNNLALLVGDHNLNTGSDTANAALYRVQSIVQHPSYDSQSRHNDIGVVKTERKMELNAAVYPICLPFYYGGNSFVNQEVTVLGWGFTDVSGQKADALQKVDLTIVDNNYCDSRIDEEIWSTQVCTYTPGKDSCFSDSGGPLLWKGSVSQSGKLELVGIISYGVGCATSKPAVNTRVTAFLSWIVSVGFFSKTKVFVYTRRNMQDKNLYRAMGFATLFNFLIAISMAVDPNCDFYQEMELGQNYYIYNPGYPDYSGPPIACRWVGKSPVGTVIVLTCEDIDIPTSYNCFSNRLSVSRTGDENFQKQTTNYCGKTATTILTEDNSIAVGFFLTNSLNVGRFSCSLTAMQTAPPTTTTARPNTCDCGWKKGTRIIGGHETGINEYPSMAAMVDRWTFDAFCGASIISDRYALTAAHCILRKTPEDFALLVGDHNMTSGDDTPYAAVYKISNMISHPNYDQNTQVNDLAVLQTEKPIEFSLFVGPVCLPFRYTSVTFLSQTVIALGWGFIDVAGPKSDTLQEVDLTVVSTEECNATITDNPVTYRQICTYAPNKDACQSDSGGPILWQDPNTRRLQLLGIISYGIGCATSRPGVNTRVTSYLRWIVSVTEDAFYCIK